VIIFAKRQALKFSPIVNKDSLNNSYSILEDIEIYDLTKADSPFKKVSERRFH
jgi:hypothetical protein